MMFGDPMRTTGLLPWRLNERARRSSLQHPPLGAERYVPLGQAEDPDASSTKTVLGAGLLITAALVAAMWWNSRD